MSFFVEQQVNGWNWPDVATFDVANAAATAALGLPIDPDTYDTQVAMSYKESRDEFGTLVLVYCGYHPQLEPILGAPSLFNVWFEYPED